MTTRTFAAILVSTSFAMTGCLPPDTRPEPGGVYITADLASAVRDSQLPDGTLVFATEDGWAITVDHLFVSIGNAGLGGEDCNEYADAGYQRILDMQQLGPQKVGQVWGLNGCLVNYALRIPPTADVVIGLGVPKSEQELMESAMVPVSSPTGMTTAQGMSMHIVGRAEKDTTTLSFDWGFSSRVRFEDCKRRIDAELESRLPLVGGKTISVNTEVDPRWLFRASPPNSGSTFIADTATDADEGPLTDAGAPPDASPPANDESTADAGIVPTVAPIPLMQLMADADQVRGNANGHIAMDELSEVVLPGKKSDLDAIPGASSNLAETIRQSSYPSMFIYGDGGQCNINVRQGRGRGGGGF